MTYPENLRYQKSHEYVELLPNGNARVGISDYAQAQLGDLVFVNLPQAGDEVRAGEPFGDLESVKAVADVLSPVGGTVCAINEELLDAPQRINENPYEAWLIEVENPTLADELMDSAAYEGFCASEG